MSQSVDNIKKITEGMEEFKNDNKSFYKLLSILKFLNFIILSLIILSSYYNFLDKSFFKDLPLFNPNLQSFLLNDSFGCLFWIIIVYMVLRFVVVKIIIDIAVSKDNDAPICIHTTIVDIFKMSILLFIMIKLLNDLLLTTNNMIVYNLNNQRIYLCYFIYCIYLFGHILYIKNSNHWYYASIDYLPYFDSEGNRIEKTNKVIYYNKIYDLTLKDSDGKWYLSEESNPILRYSYLLEDAVKDEQGNLRICEFNTGKRGSKNK